MPYTVKLKDQTGTEVTYSAIEQVSIPLASGSGNATFTARYSVAKTASANITYDGGDYASNGVDCLCRISTGSTGKGVPSSITVKINNKEVKAGEAYVYTKVSTSEAFVKVLGSYITGDVVIQAVAT